MTLFSRFLVCALAGAGLLAAETRFYLSPEGDDAAPGTRGQPWRSMAKANAAAAPGTTLVFLPGTYEGCLEPARSGEAGSPVVFRAEEAGTVTLRGGVSGDGVRTCLRLVDREHVRIVGFHLRPPPGIGWFQFLRVRHSLLAECDMDDARGGARPADCRDCHYNRFVDLRCTRANNLGQWGHVSGDLWNNWASSHNVFERVYISGVGHRPFGLWFDCSHNVLRECVFDCRWGRNFEFFSTTRLLMERCLVTNGFDGSGSADGRAKLFVVDSIVRRNLIYRNHYGPVVANSYTYEKLPTFGLLRSRIYHNTWYRNHDYGLQLVDLGQKPDPHQIQGNVFLNNLFADNDPGGDGIALRLATNLAPDNRFAGNLLWGGHPEAPVVRLDWPGNENLTAEQANLHQSGWFAENFAAPPGFADPERDIFELAPDSPAGDRGLPLTRTRAAGQGTLLPVVDARWFYDGFGIPGEQGDEIVVGGTTVRVLRADLETNTLEVDREIAWEAFAPVFPPHTGTAPDLGAYERGMATGPQVPEGLRVETMETAGKIVVHTDFEPENLETWHYYWNFSRQQRTDSRLDATTAFSGRYAVRVFATEDAKDRNDALLSCDIRPRWWDVDRFPEIRLAYRIPPGVPVGLWLHAFQGAGAPERRVCLGGTPARAVGSAPDLARYTLLDDGKWHEISLDARLIRETFPEVKLIKMFRFYTHRNGKHGDQFWFDNFRILPASAEK
ncbi:MAG: right-handed parallel beta-helix repeat-containing protein [Lentisphaeria bacterium]|jgi:hypothetical protein|nr:right-handed parallel beta-helix repeat-containing protein [Lentisphaeria bacterium]